MNNLERKTNLIIDTDPGHDDALALLTVLNNPRLNPLAITTVAGNASIEKVTQNATAIRDLADSKIPVYSGQPTPLERLLVTAVVHGASGLDGYDTSNTSFALTENAPQKIVELVSENEQNITILTLGPLTNLARAIALEPSLPTKISSLVMMGGAIEVPGNKNRVAEFNFFVDPEAAAIVFKADVPKVLIPLDICNNIVLKVADFAKLKNQKIRQALLPMMEHFTVGLRKGEGVSGILVYDVLAAYFLTNPDAYTLTPMNIVIETKGEYTFGMSVAERRPYKSEIPNVSVVTKLDEDTFRRDFFKLLEEN